MANVSLSITSFSTMIACLNMSDVALAFVLIILILITVVGNLLVIASVCVYKKMRTFTNVLLVSLATSDLLVGVLISPLALIDQLYNHNWQFSYILCTSWATSDVLLCTASILNLCAISIDRYFAITSPLLYTRTRTMRMAGALVAVVWVLSLIVCTPPYLVPQWKYEDPYSTTPAALDPSASILSANLVLKSANKTIIYDSYTCTYSNAIGYRVYSALGSFYIPLIIMLFVYVRIFQVANNRENELNKLALGGRSSSNMRVFVGKKRMDNGNGTSSLHPPPSPAKLHIDRGDNRRSSSLFTPNSSRNPSNCNISASNSARMGVNRNLRASLDSDYDSIEIPGPMRPDHRPNLSKQHRVISSSDGFSTISRKSSPHDSIEMGDADSFARTTSTAESINDEDSMVLMTTGQVSHLTKQARHWYSRAMPTNLMLKANTSYSKTRQGGKHKQDREKALYIRERKALKTIGIVVSGFICCWLPFFIFYLVALTFDENQEASTFTQVLGDIFLWLGYSNSAINPLIYTFYNRDFRRCFRDLILCGCCKMGIRRGGRMSVRLLHQRRPV